MEDGAFIPQRLVDPELCTACYGCHEVCPRGAVVIDHRRVAIDPALCENCGACVYECASDAIDTIRMVRVGQPYLLAQQLAWDALPSAEAGL
jgi:MinD superfamily P-loop ATPase